MDLLYMNLLFKSFWNELLFLSVLPTGQVIEIISHFEKLNNVLGVVLI